MRARRPSFAMVLLAVGLSLIFAANAAAQAAKRPRWGTGMSRAFQTEKHGLRQRVNQKHYTVHLDEYFDHFLKAAR